MASVGEIEVMLAMGEDGDPIVLDERDFQAACGAAFDLGTREWEHERAAVAIDRLLSGVEGGDLSLPDAVKAAIGDGMIDRAVAVLRGSKREFLITNLRNPIDLQERGEVRIREMDLDVTGHGVVYVVARFTVVPLPAHDFGWRQPAPVHPASDPGPRRP
jgi:hypothetical protein